MPPVASAYVSRAGGSLIFSVLCISSLSVDGRSDAKRGWNSCSPPPARGLSGAAHIGRAPLSIRRVTPIPRTGILRGEPCHTHAVAALLWQQSLGQDAAYRQLAVRHLSKRRASLAGSG
jgi:hypothetical protein